MNEKGLIAPCGMNCGICKGYLREKRKCPNCEGIVTRHGGICLSCGYIKFKN